MRETVWWVREDKDGDGNVIDRIPFAGNAVPAGLQQITFAQAAALEEARKTRATRGYQFVTIEERERVLNEETARAKANMKPDTAFAEVDEHTSGSPPPEDQDAMAVELRQQNAELRRQLAEKEAADTAIIVDGVIAGATEYVPAHKSEPDPDLESVARPARRARFGNRKRFRTRESLKAYADTYYPNSGIGERFTRFDMERILKDLQDAEFAERETAGVT